MKLAEEKNVFWVEDEDDNCNEAYSQRRDLARFLFFLDKTNASM
jgi:hypothetical protein